MLVPFLIMLREGIEAALIVGIVASYLARTGRSQWMPWVWLGIVLAVTVSLSAGAALQWLSAEFPQKAQELFEAVVGGVAACVLVSMVFWMRRAGRNMGQDIRSTIDRAFVQNRRGGAALVLMVFLAVAREGLESVFFLLAAFQQSDSASAPLGALLGVAVAAVLGYGLYAGGIRLDLRRFFKWTGVLILFVAAGLLAGSVKALHEAGLWNHFQTVVVDWSQTFPADSAFGTLLAGLFGYIDTPTVSEVTVYVVFLVTSLYLFLRPSRPAIVSPAASHGVAAGPSSAPAGGGDRFRTENVSDDHMGTVPRARMALAVSVVLLIASGAAFYLASRAAVRDRPPADDAVLVVIGATHCEPDSLSVPAGRTVFRIENRSSRVVEWEILDGVMVVEERENIAPGFTQTLTARLSPGRYQMTCGLLSNPRGTLEVVANAASAAASAAKPKLVAFIGAMAEYNVYLSRESRAFALATQEIVAALDAGALDRAQEGYQRAQLAYAHLSPAAGSFGDLATRIDAPATYFERRDTDPDFRGLRRLGPLLVPDADVRTRARLAQELAADAATLEQRVKTLTLPPDQMINGAERALRQSVDAQVSAPQAQATVAGVQKIYALLGPFVQRRDPSLDQTIQTTLTECERAMPARSAPQPLQSCLATLAEQWTGVSTAIGYE